MFPRHGHPRTSTVSEFSGGRMPSRPGNVHGTQQSSGQCDHAKTRDFTSTGGLIPYSPAIFARGATSASCTTRSSSPISNLSPFARIAARCAPRATRLTSTPARASCNRDTRRSRQRRRCRSSRGLFRASDGIFSAAHSPGFDQNFKASSIAAIGSRYQAGMDHAAAVAWSSNAVAMSRMLTTPIRL
jgi:hypothetical protein